MLGYKAMNPNMTCLGFQYEVGETYKIEGPPIICRKGFHFCKNLYDVFNYYQRDYCTICEVEALGEVEAGHKKSCTNEIHIVRVLSQIEQSRAKNGCGYGVGGGRGGSDGDGCGDGVYDWFIQGGTGYGLHYHYGYIGGGGGNGYQYGNEDGGGRGSGTFLEPSNISRVLVWEE